MQKKQISPLSLAIFLVAALLLPAAIEARCGVCNLNAIACMSETTFQICDAEGEIMHSPHYACPNGLVCTEKSDGCAIPNGADSFPACTPNAKGCGCASTREMIACTGRNTFTLCLGRSATHQTGVCPPGLVCNPNGQTICVSEAEAQPACDK